MIKEIVILLSVITFNFWFWRIVKENIFIGILLTLLTIFLYMLITQKRFQIITFVATFILLLVASSVVLKSDFVKEAQLQTPEDQIKLTERHFYYAEDLGKVFLNSKVLNYYKNYSLLIYKLQQNFFSNLDINLYFFASHPRERATIGEFEKYPSILLPIFIIGVLLLIYKGSIWGAGYLLYASLVSAFVSPKYTLGPLLFFPFINVTLVMGAIYAFKIFKR